MKHTCNPKKLSKLNLKYKGLEQWICPKCKQVYLLVPLLLPKEEK
jgi:hypothetical protein